MNRNIVTEADVAERSGREVATRDGAAAQLTTDDYWTRLAKYVPVEMISAYLIVQGLIETAYDEQPAPRAYALGILLLVTAVATWFFSARVLGVRRSQQLAMSVVALIVWVLAIGGWFATTGWWQSWIGTVGVVAFGVLVRILGLPPLPPDTQL